MLSAHSGLGAVALVVIRIDVLADYRRTVSAVLCACAVCPADVCSCGVSVRCAAGILKHDATAIAGSVFNLFLRLVCLTLGSSVFA